MDTGKSNEAEFAQVGAGISVRLGPQPEPGHRREDGRGQQHDGGVEAEHGGDHAGDGEHQGEQGHGPAAGASRHPCPGRLEQAVPVAHVGEDEHGGQKTNGRGEAA